MAVRFTAAFDDVARARARLCLCESSGSDHSPVQNSVLDLSQMVESFLERENKVEKDQYEENKNKNKNKTKSFCRDPETKDMLISLIGNVNNEKRLIVEEMKMGCRGLGSCLSEGFKRHLMTWLRHRGFDAGLCKSRWEKSGRHPAGEYEYIDILISKTRYILDVSLATHFTIARPTQHYVSLLQTLPPLVVCKESELKQVVRLMCASMRESLKESELHVPPWRVNGYMQSKWFGTYKRTTNAESNPGNPNGGLFAGKCFIGFEMSNG